MRGIIRTFSVGCACVVCAGEPLRHEAWFDAMAVAVQEVPQMRSWQSPRICGGEQAQSVEVNVSGWSNLWLIVDNCGNYNHDLANWGEARLVSADGRETRLSELTPCSVQQQWGHLKKNQNALGKPLRFPGNQTMEHGLGTHAQSAICFALPAHTYTAFRTWYGVDAAKGSGQGEVRFCVAEALPQHEAMKAIWAQLEKQYGADRVAHAEMLREQRDAIWMPRATPEQVAARYCAQMSTAYRLRAQQIAVTNWFACKAVRAVYCESQLAEHVARRRASMDGDAVLLALDDLIQTFGSAYPQGESYRAQFRALLSTLTTTSDLHAQDIALEQLETLRRKALLANPLLDCDRIVAVRRRPQADARTASDGAIGMVNNWRTMQSIGASAHLDDEIVELSNLRDAVRERIVFRPAQKQAVIDTELHFNADRIAFAMAGEKEKNFRLWEVSLDGTGLRQLSPDDGEDVAHADPCYLPDGTIIFTSTAVYQGLPCTFGGDFMMCLYRLDPASHTVRQLTFEQDSNWSPTVLPNGRVLYQRWEYTDAAHANSRMLFSMNPDGTDQREFRGSGSWFPGSFFFARPLPGQSRRVIGVAGGHHDRCRSGRLLILDSAAGRRDDAGVVAEIPYRGKKTIPVVRDGLIGNRYPQFLHPYPLSEKYHLVSMKPAHDVPWGIYLVDVFNNQILVQHSDDSAYLEPALVMRQMLPARLPDRVDLTSKEARVHIQDIYSGPGLEGVPHGVVKGIRVIEYYFSRRGMGGLYGTVGMDGPWDIKRILGVAPVAADGSAYFKIPANCTVSLQPIDEKGQALQVMRSWVIGQPGETISCAGCHEQQDMAPPQTPPLNRKPDALEPWRGPARGFSFVREVQPVLDQYCVACHDGVKAKPDFTPERPITDWSTKMSGHWSLGGKFTQAYFNLWRYLRTPGIEGDRRMFTPLDYHFSQTELAQMLMKHHQGVQLDPESWTRLAAWHDLNAPFFGTWGEIPGLADKVVKTAARAKELRARYAPANNDIDMERYPEVPRMVSNPCPRQVRSVKAADQTLGDRALSADAARAVQAQSAPNQQVRNVITIPVNGGIEPGAATYIRVVSGFSGRVGLGEVEIYCQGRNIADQGQAWMSDDGADGLSMHERLAVDGDVQTVSSTRDAQMCEWWETRFAVPQKVERIVLAVPTSALAQDLKDARLVVMDAQRRVIWRKRLDFGTALRTECVITAQQCDPVRFEFAWIPPGDYRIGGGADDARPATVQHRATGFWMLVSEITNEQMREFIPTFESRTEDRHGYQFGISGYEQDFPDQSATRVSWREAQAFCTWLSRLCGARIQLPSEGEWEHAARAGCDTPFWWGNGDADFSRYANLGDAMLAYFSGNPYVQDYKKAWCKNPENPYDNWIPQEHRVNDAGFVTVPVMRYMPNPWGLYDMHGNVREWTRSRYLDYPYAEDAARNSIGTDATELRVTRGGSWRERPKFCTASHRLAYPTWQRVYNVGFRVMMETSVK